MKHNIRFSTMLALLLVAVQTALAAAPAGYYNAASGKSDEALMSAMRNIIRDHKQLSYNSLWDAFKTTDTDAQGYIIDLYSNCRYRPSDHGGNASNVGDGFNREHSFPKSGFDDGTPMYTDLFHLYPTDIKVNNQRSNYPFGVCKDGKRLVNGDLHGKGKLGISTYPGYGGTVFEPDDEYKGDFARTYFYMVTCYKNELPSWRGSDQLDYKTNKYKAFSTWSISMLMEWTRLDPVSDKEIKRNDAVYKLQGNRNPFIDHPELAEHIWGNMQGQPWNGSGEPVPASITSPASGSIFDMGTTSIDTPLEYTVTVKGEGLNSGLTLSMADNENYYVNKNYFTAAEAIQGTTFTITFTGESEGTFENALTLSSSEVSTTFTVIATAREGEVPGPGPDPVLGDSITEDWENCVTGGYWNDVVQGHAFVWEFTNAGIWGDNLCHDELVCLLGKTSSSTIAMGEDYEGATSAISFWAGCFGSDADARLNVDYSTDQGATWTTLGAVTATKGSLQHFLLTADVNGPVRYRIAQTAGSRVNIDDITLYKQVQQAVVRGDVDGDSEVTISDVNTVIRIILGNPYDAEVITRADTNQDGEVNIADVDLIIGIITGRITAAHSH